MLIFKPETNSIVTVLSVLSNRENRIAAKIITIPGSKGNRIYFTVEVDQCCELSIDDVVQLLLFMQQKERELK